MICTIDAPLFSADYHIWWSALLCNLVCANGENTNDKPLIFLGVRGLKKICKITNFFSKKVLTKRETSAKMNKLFRERLNLENDTETKRKKETDDSE